MPNVTTAALRAAHKAALMQVKSAVPIGQKRLTLLKRLDQIASQIRATETMKAQSK